MMNNLCCVSSQDNSATEVSNKIDQLIKKEKNNYRKKVKILLLGPGESGKSTFLKQLKIISGRSFTNEELKEYKTIIYNNILRSFQVLCDARQKLNLFWTNKDLQPYSENILSISLQKIEITYTLFLECVEKIKQLWLDDSIKKAYGRRNEFLMVDSLGFYMEHLDRISSKDYVPTQQDILYCRKATKGIVQYEFEMKGIPFVIVDVGGQRSQRRKWFLCFDSVTSILFLTSASAYDQVIMEDRETNVLTESVNIFNVIVKTFPNISVILFLNKYDLLIEKVQSSDISKYFSNFKGDPHNVDDVKLFLVEMFQSCRIDHSKALFHHFTTAINTENIRFVFDAVQDTILQDNLKSLMLE